MTAPPTSSRTLYDPQFEHDACGVGFVVNITGARSHRVLQRAVESVRNVFHRGGVGADAATGDGAGLLTQIPSGIFYPQAARMGYHVRADGDLAVGVVFLPPDQVERSRAVLEEACSSQGLNVLGWREVLIDPSALGELARSTMPQIEHLLVARPEKVDVKAFTRRLYLARKEAESVYSREEIDCYIPSLSNRTICYKGMLLAPHLADFYLDLQDPKFETALAVLHQRYSTNTFPNWALAQPFRLLAHNGEINTLQGNRTWMRAREPVMVSSIWGDAVDQLKPVVQPGGSDSTSLDNALELVELSGRDLLHAMTMLVPEAWENMPHMDLELRAYYEYHACLTEPWDGPAALAFTDGTVVAAALDRNGLRPARYIITDDNIMVVNSEVGTIDIESVHVVEKGRIGPGQIIAVDTARGVVLKNQEIKERVAAQRPYSKWLQQKMSYLAVPEAPGGGKTSQAKRELPPTADVRLQHAFAYTTEEAHLVLRPLYLQGVEPVGSLGDDTPLSVLATRPRLLYSYFKQRFAQVTNPPIDPLREQLVMSLYTYLGSRGSLLEEEPEHAALLRLDSPILTDDELSGLAQDGAHGLTVAKLSALFSIDAGPSALESAVHRLRAQAEEEVDAGCSLLIISDRGVDAEHAAIPMLMAVGAVHHHLICAGKRMRASIVVETGEAREMHHFALLIGYGASAINPYLAFSTIRQQVEGHDVDLAVERALSNYMRIIQKQLLKIMSKMGISIITAYHGAQIFEAIGVGQEVIEACFPGTPSPVGGIGFEAIALEVLGRHGEVFVSAANGKAKLDDHGFFRYRRGGEPHAFSPVAFRMVHEVVKEEGTGYEGYKRFAEMAAGQEPITLRDLLVFKRADSPIPLSEVEPAAEIVKRFNGGSMSFGALSMEAHETIATAFNRIGGRSGSGEGGEDPRRFRERRNGDSSNSAMKQVASGRFGVTPEYLAMADVLEIKMAQGSKPGEGGQLPGHKVTEVIAHIRHTQAGVPLISPPPHHDIYSIEDLAQLIYDLKVVNPRARVAVKLVAEAGVGTIAAGVAKGYADFILIAGMDGGTGASPLVSIKHAGSPWEIGLAEMHQVLVLNDLRGRVTLRTDGGFRTGRDVAVAALLGAEEFGFGTAAMVAVGCTVARQCHLNTCPVGVATQDPELRKKFTGTPEMLVRYLFYLAEELREIMASLGLRTVDEMIGRSDLLEQVGIEGHPKVNSLDFSRLLALPDPSGKRPRRHMQERNDRDDDTPLDDELLPLVAQAMEGRSPAKVERPIRNVHRTVGARIAGEIAYRHGDKGLMDNSIELRFWGSAGQSFGAFCIGGMHMTLEGDANDYVGKGMHGGEIVIYPPYDAPYFAHDNVIMGNTVLYGATGGRLFAAGRAGERFAVRNSGAWTVVEGTGDHCCEYMTGGVVVVLGPVGRNLGAGMSGGVAYVLDMDDSLSYKLNAEMAGMGPVEDEHDQEVLHTLVHHHQAVTRSVRAEDVLDNWAVYLPKFKRVSPLPHVAPPTPREQERARRDALLATGRRRSSRL